MTKYTRLTGKVFGSSATATGDDPEIGQFGSALAGTYNGTTDVSIIQSLPAWQKGFIGCVTPNTQFPPLPEMTGFGKVLSQQICYLLQQGIPEYDSGTTYYTGNWVSYNSSIYVAKADNLLNIAPTDTTKWNKFTGAGARNLGEYITSSLPLTDDTLHLADGSLLSQQDYPEFTSYIANLYNSLPSGEFSQATQNANLATLQSWVGIAYGFINGVGKYIALNGSGYISDSTDGINWSVPVKKIGNSFISMRDIIYDGTQFVAIAQAAVYTSQDTETWTEVYATGWHDYYKLAYGNGKYVILSRDGGISYSEDLTNWTAKTFDADNLGDCISFIDNDFIIVNKTQYNVHFHVSSDLINWNDYYSLTLPRDSTYCSLTHSNNKYMLINSNGYTSETTSLDQSWSTLTQNTNIGSNSWQSLCYNNLQTKAVILGASGYISSLEIPFTNVFTTEADWQAEYTAYGECGKYVYNSGANTIRIPAVNSYFTNTSNAQSLGNLTPASIPNIKGVISANEKLYKSGTSVSDYGAFNNVQQNVVSGQSDNSHFDNDLWDFDASRVSSVYSDSATTVNTQSIKQLVYIVVKK